MLHLRRGPIGAHSHLALELRFTCATVDSGSANSTFPGAEIDAQLSCCDDECIDYGCKTIKQAIDWDPQTH